MTHCEAGHDFHERVTLDLSLFKMTVFDAEIYRNTYGYCPGDSALSRAIIESGMWEYWSYKMLTEWGVFQGNTVIDLGANMGWYSLLAAESGCSVVAVEADPEYSELFTWNIAQNGWGGRVTLVEEWIDEGWSLLPTPTGVVDLIKVDLEGKDIEAIDGVWGKIVDGDVSYLLVEISPVFRSGYPEMVKKIMDVGYDATVVDPEPFSLPSLTWINDCHQVDILFSKGS